MKIILIFAVAFAGIALIFGLATFLTYLASKAIDRYILKKNKK